MRAIAKSCFDSDFSYAFLCRLQKSACIAQSQLAVGERRAHGQRFMEQAFQLPRGQLQARRDGLDGQGLGDMLVHQQDRASHPVVADAGGAGMRLCVAARAGVLQLQDVQSLLRGLRADMPFDQEGGKIGDAASAGAGDAIPVLDEKAVRIGRLVGNSVSKSAK